MLWRLRERGVLRVAGAYAVIAWLLLQIADVTFEPLGVPRWLMTAVIAAAVLGFPVAIALAWHFELGDHGLERDVATDSVARPVDHGLRRYTDVALLGVTLAAAGVSRAAPFPGGADHGRVARRGGGAAGAPVGHRKTAAAGQPDDRSPA